MKVVKDINSKALYFSRAAIPYGGVEEIDMYKHIGIYGFDRKTLIELSKLDQSPLEKMESLEQLRWLEHGHSIFTVTTTGFHLGVDTIEDLEKARIIAVSKE